MLKPNPPVKQVYEELIRKPLTDDELAEIVANLTRYIEMLTEIEKKQKEQSKNKHKEKD